MMQRVIVMVMTLLSLLAANEGSIIDRIVNLYNVKTNGAFEFNATKSGDGYDITVSPQDSFYSELLNPKFIHVNVDEGPIVTSPKFTLAKAGLNAKGSFFDFFKPKVAAEMKKGIKEDITYSYSAIVSFGGEFNEELTIAPLKIDDKNMTVKASKLLMKSQTDLDTYKSTTDLTLDHLFVEDKVTKQLFALKGLKIENVITDKPVDNIILFGKTALNIKELEFKVSTLKKKVDAKFSLNASSAIKRVDSKFLDVNFILGYKALDAKSIALLEGIKSGRFEFAFKNFGIQGVVELIKLSQKLQKINSKMMQASKSGNDIEIQKSIIESTEVMNELIPIINHSLIKDKSRVVLDWQMQSDKHNYIKADFLYKGEPLAGSNIQSAFISLMAQQLTIVDGSFDIALERDLIVKINPLSILFLDMLKQKGFITVKDSVYRLKGELKGGKIILNGKAYTIEELSRALF